MVLIVGESPEGRDEELAKDHEHISCYFPNWGSAAFEGERC